MARLLGYAYDNPEGQLKNAEHGPSIQLTRVAKCSHGHIVLRSSRPRKPAMRFGTCIFESVRSAKQYSPVKGAGWLCSGA